MNDRASSHQAATLAAGSSRKSLGPTEGSMSDRASRLHPNHTHNTQQEERLSAMISRIRSSLVLAALGFVIGPVLHAGAKADEGTNDKAQSAPR